MVGFAVTLARARRHPPIADTLARRQLARITIHHQARLVVFCRGHEFDLVARFPTTPHVHTQLPNTAAPTAHVGGSGTMHAGGAAGAAAAAPTPTPVKQPFSATLLAPSAVAERPTAAAHTQPAPDRPQAAEQQQQVAAAAGERVGDAMQWVACCTLTLPHRNARPAELAVPYQQQQQQQPSQPAGGLRAYRSDGGGASCSFWAWCSQTARGSHWSRTNVHTGGCDNARGASGRLRLGIRLLALGGGLERTIPQRRRRARTMRQLEPSGVCACVTQGGGRAQGQRHSDTRVMHTRRTQRRARKVQLPACWQHLKVGRLAAR